MWKIVQQSHRKEKSKCDYHFNRNLTEAEILELNQRVNDTIKRNLAVVEEFITRDEANEKFNLERLPDSAGETIRIIKIGDYDSCPCSGLHVSNTEEIGSFKIISTDFNNGVLRIRFKLQNTE